MSGGLGPAEGQVLLLNSMDVLRSTFAAAGARRHEARVTADMDRLLGDLARGAAQETLAACGLAAKLAALQTADAQPHISMATVVGLEPLALGSAMRSFYSLLFRQGDALLPHADAIASPTLRRQAVALTARAVSETHAHIHELVSRPTSGYQEAHAILLHTPEEIETLLAVA